MNEQIITDRLRQRAGFPPGSPVVLGIGDDCAVYRPRGSADDLLFTSDLCIENVHFRLATHKPADIAWIAIARSMSDIAAMGGRPRCTLLAASLGRDAGAPDHLLDTMARVASGFGAPLAGGDLARSATTFFDVTICGAVPRGTALRRDGARPGHSVYVSGQLGGAALGLESGRGRAWRRHVRPEPRLALGEFLRTSLRASACIDLSDGLSLDLRRLCVASRVAAEITAPPRFPGATLAQALHGGEDYELLFTARPGTRVPERFHELRLTRIGTIIEGPPGLVRIDGRVLDPLGFDHFSRK